MQSENPFSSASLSKVLRLAEVLGGEGGSITASLVLQRITREALWGLNSSLGISGGNGTMLLQLEGFISYHRYEDALGEQKSKDVYRGQKFDLGNIPLELKTPGPVHSPKQNTPLISPPTILPPESIPSPYLNPSLTSPLQADPYSTLASNHNVNFPLPHQGGDFHVMAHQNAILLNSHIGQSPILSLQSVSSFSSEDNGRKRSREQEALDAGEDSDSDHLEEGYIEDEANVDMQQLHLHTAEMPSVPRQRLASFHTHEETSQIPPSLTIPSYPMKVNKIGTSRPRKKHSPSPASSSTHPGVDNGSTAAKKRSGISLVQRIWHGIYEGTKLAKQFRGEIGLDIVQAARTVSLQLRNVFKDINRHCSTLYSSSGSFRILDLIMQAIWVDLFHARVATLASEPQNQYNSPTDNNILALKESRSVFECSEKEMRNKLAIWSGYKKIKDTGGWPALIFAEEGGGVYNVCKYRAGGWKEGIFDELEQLREAIELAADTLQPEWRRLIEVLFGSDNGIPERRCWEGQYPHQWVIGLDGTPIPLSETYLGGLEYELIEASVIDEESWGDRDPRRVVPEGDEPYLCNTCGEIQSEEPLGNKCLCYPDLYGGGAGRRGGKYSPVQICRTQDKGNGLIARLPIPAGAGVGEFVGTITRGLRGVDVMEGGIEPNKYQISQARRGNFTRFINHSCNPNTQFKVFIWLGIERIIIVSNGVKAGTEVTVDYSNGYWEGLDKVCRCGEEQCRFPRGGAVVYADT
ncbi:hypothetical protein EV426DRAFT_332991 [Tirmania nivea]|nr:hypothetical protein EV426DRAFT_332991 [Tirmania nivea]